jgi:F-type H+-transporting ATPase subunit delta
LIGSKVTKRYAKALMGLGREDGRYEQYGKELQEFSQFCRDYQEFGYVIGNQVFSLEDRKKILNVILGRSGFSDLMRNFLNLLLDKDRIGAIDQITTHYERLTDEISNIARAEVTTPSALGTAAQDKLKKALGDLTKKEIRMEIREDKSLIGGVLVKIGDMVLDGTVKAQLQGLKESLKRSEYN